MMMLEVLTSWRVAAIEGRLPEPVRSGRWQPLRAGVVNLWEYDTAEVWYADGRMQLQGANESGKSTLMTLTTLLLLAGEITSHNIDTLGQNDKRFRYYVEPTDHPLDRRDTSAQKNRGWAWLEFGRGAQANREADFFTLLLSAETRRADTNMTVSWCTLRGQARVRSGLSLTTAGFVADPARFKDIPGFTAHPTGTAYRETIARVLYDMDEAWLNQLNRILRVVRTPQIGHKIDLKFLTQAFRTALPPIAQDEVNQLADGWEQLQRLRDERDEADQALAAVTDFSRRSWRPWADAVIRAAADPVASVASALTRITREESAARETVKTLTKQKDDLDEQHAGEEEAQQLATAEREALQEQDAYKDAVSAVANARQLADRASQAETTAKRSEQRASKAQADVLPAHQRQKTARENLDSAERSVETAADAVSAHATKAGLADVTAQHVAERDTARLRQASRLRTAAARRADELIETHSKALGKAESAATEAAKVRKRVGQAEQTAAEKNAEVEAAITTTADTLSTWIQGVDERIRPSAETAESWASLVAGLPEKVSPSPVLAMAISREHLIPVRRPHEKRQAELDKALSDNVEDRKNLQVQLDQIEAERDPVPGDPEFWQRRQRPEGVTAEGAPFWRLVETLDDAPVAMLEAALDAAGLLQAWATPDGMYLASRDGDETVWAPGAGEVLTAASLRDVLRPADDAGELAAAVDHLLTRVAYGTDLSAHPVTVSPDGRWRHGELTGTASPRPESPKLLGAAARAADRIRRAEQIRKRIADLADDHELMSLELDDVVGLLAALDTASDHMPSDSEVVTAVLAARDAAKTVADLQTEAIDAGKIADAAQSAADASAATVAGHCDEHDLPRTRPEVADVLAALADYLSAITTLEGKMSLIEPLSTAAKHAEEALNGLVEAAGTAAADAEEDRTAARTLRSQADAAGKALSKDAQEILREVSRLGKRIKDAGDTLRQLDKNLLELVTKLARAQTVLEETEGKRESAEADREAAANRWWACVDSGLPRLRAVPGSPSRNVTAALENSRAARAMISPRNWPDSDQQHQFAQVVQNRWATMVNDSSGLRSKLELLGGRSVQVTSPGDGREDFPGSLQLIIDSTGTALAPPRAAERLSALLDSHRVRGDEMAVPGRSLPGQPGRGARHGYTRPDQARCTPPARAARAAHGPYQHAFNPARPAKPASTAAQILDWAQQASLPVSCLSEPTVLRAALEALTFQLDGSRAAANTITRKRAVLHSALGYTAEAGLLPDNPLDTIAWQVPRSSAALNPVVVASPSQVSALLDAVARTRPEMTAFFGCLYYAALRPEEAVALRYADCHLPGSGWGMLRLAAAAPRTAAWTSTGTSHEQRGLKHRPDGTIRMVPAPPVLTAMLRAHHAAYGTAPDGRLFRGTRGGPLSESVYGRAWHAARTLALGPELAASGLARRPYDLRHAALSLWLNAGGNPAQIAARAGHSVAVLLTVYSHCIHGRDDLLNQQIDQVLEPPTRRGPCPSVRKPTVAPTARLRRS